MKTLVSAIIIAAATAIPIVSFAQQPNDSLTRAQVRAQLDTAQQERSGSSIKITVSESCTIEHGERSRN